MNKNWLIIIVIALVLILAGGYLFAEKSSGTVPSSLQELCRERLDTHGEGVFSDALKLHTCEPNSAGAGYSLRIEETGDLGTDYYDSKGERIANCGAFREGSSEAEICAVLRTLDCSALASC